MKTAFRIRLNITPVAKYITLDEEQVRKEVQDLLGHYIKDVLRDISGDLGGIQIGLDAVDRLEGEYWTPYADHDPSSPTTTGYHISLGGDTD